MRNLIAFILIVVWSSSALSQGDPYAQEYNKSLASQYLNARERFLGSVKTIYFATICKVIDEPSLAVMMANLEEALAFEMHRNNLRGDEKAIDLENDAERQGVALGKRPGGCDYWHNHPEAVLEMRRTAAAAFR